MTIRRISFVRTFVSATWYVIPRPTAKYAKSVYSGSSSWLKSIPPTGSAYQRAAYRSM